MLIVIVVILAAFVSAAWSLLFGLILEVIALVSLYRFFKKPRG
jgi:hypothetical protein